MKVRVLGCYGGNIPGYGMTSFLVNDSVALDAGWVSDALTLAEQEKVKDIFISHSHLDHTCSLPFLIDNNFSMPGFALRIFGIREVVETMKQHLFNNLTWPDFTCLPNDLTPVLKLVTIEEEEPVEVNGLKVTAVRVSHTIPTTGFLVDDGKHVLAFSSDTGPTKHFWEHCNRSRRLKAIITECSFPNKLQHIANVSGHLTPQTLANELRKIKADVPIYIYGRKPRYARLMAREIREIRDSRVRLLTQGRTYTI
jgi:cAMP phosphodiesterase